METIMIVIVCIVGILIINSWVKRIAKANSSTIRTHCKTFQNWSASVAIEADENSAKRANEAINRLKEAGITKSASKLYDEWQAQQQ